MAKTLAREKCTSADYDNAHVQCDKTASIFLVGNRIFFFRMQTEVYKPTEEGKSFIDRRVAQRKKEREEVDRKRMAEEEAAQNFENFQKISTDFHILYIFLQKFMKF